MWDISKIKTQCDPTQFGLLFQVSWLHEGAGLKCPLTQIIWIHTLMPSGEIVANFSVQSLVLDEQKI